MRCPPETACREQRCRTPDRDCQARRGGRRAAARGRGPSLIRTSTPHGKTSTPGRRDHPRQVSEQAAGGEFVFGCRVAADLPAVSGYRRNALTLSADTPDLGGRKPADLESVLGQPRPGELLSAIDRVLAQAVKPRPPMPDQSRNISGRRATEPASGSFHKVVIWRQSWSVGVAVRAAPPRTAILMRASEPALSKFIGRPRTVAIYADSSAHFDPEPALLDAERPCEPWCSRARRRVRKRAEPR